LSDSQINKSKVNEASRWTLAVQFDHGKVGAAMKFAKIADDGGDFSHASQFKEVELPATRSGHSFNNASIAKSLGTLVALTQCAPSGFQNASKMKFSGARRDESPGKRSNAIRTPGTVCERPSPQ